jgi:hypothetical protein
MPGKFKPGASAGANYLAGIHAAAEAARKAKAPAEVHKAIRTLASEHVNRDRSKDKVLKKAVPPKKPGK